MAKMSFADRVKKKAKEAEFQGGSDTIKLQDGMSFFKPKKGRNDIMIIPFEMTLAKNLEDIEKGELWYRLQIKKHFGIGSEDKAVICPTTIGKKCPICEHRAQLLAQGRGTDDAEVKALSAKKRELYYVIDVNSEEQNVQVYEPSYFLFGKKLEEEIREADEEDELVANFADPNDGAVLEVRMSEETMGKNKFLEASRIDFESRNKQETKLAKEAAENVPPMSDLLVVMSYEELKNVFYDIDPDSEDGEDTAPARKRKVAEDEDEDDKPKRDKKPSRGSEDGEDEQDEKPRRGKVKDEDAEEDERPKRPKRSVKDEDEDDKPKRDKKPAKDEDEDEAPKPRGRKKVGGDCPGNGTFGEDCDSLDACEDCPNWADCRDATDEYEKAKRNKK